MKIMIIGMSHDADTLSMIRHQIMLADKGAEIIMADSLPEVPQMEKVDLVIQAEDHHLVPNLIKDSIMEFKLHAMDHYDYPSPKKMKKLLKEPKGYRSKKDRRNHR